MSKPHITKIMYEEDNIEPEFLKRHKDSPFRTPDHYFGSLDDRIIANIQHEAKKKTSTFRAIQILKPILGLAASFALVFLLVYYPINKFMPKSVAKIQTTDTTAVDSLHNYAFNISLIDENGFLKAIFGDETVDTTKINTDEVLAYLSTNMTDVDIYSEIQN